MTNITFKQMATRLEEEINNRGGHEFFKEILSYSDTRMVLDGKEIFLMKIDERLYNVKRKFVQTQFMIFEMKEEGFYFSGVLSVDSTVNKTSGKNLRFSAFRNPYIRETVQEDIIRTFMAFKFFNKFEDYNNMLGLVLNLRDDNGNLIREDIHPDTLFEEYDPNKIEGLQLFI